MHLRNREDRTIEYYERSAAQFAQETFALNMEALYKPFLARLPRGGRILDAGCGSGRDAAHFASLGYQVAAFDASPAMVVEARKRTGLDVRCLTFQEIDFNEVFDGVWACASLLHVPHEEMPGVLRRLAAVLRHGGVLYVSYKHGEGERRDEAGRLFTDYTETRFEGLLSRVPELSLDQMWVSGDVRPGRKMDRWLNALLTRR